jgi:kynurenine formamidase
MKSSLFYIGGQYLYHMYIDLTLSLDNHTPVFPGSIKPKIIQLTTIDTKGYNEQKIMFSTHVSTHIDAPRHMLASAKTLTDYDIDTFVGDAILIDVRGQKTITADLTDVYAKDIVFFYTGHSQHIHEPTYFSSNPVLSTKTALALIDRQIKIVGFDTFSPDNEPYHIHKLLFQHDILIVENLMHLDRLPTGRFRCYILPLKIQDADGAPCRVVAQI